MPITSTNMGLPIPTVGVDPSPTWATLLNQCLTIIDGHNHTNGSGVPIVPGAININSDLTFNSNNAIALRASRFTAQGSPIPASGNDLNEVYVSGVDLYYNDGNGNQVRITQSGGVAGSPGSISNLSSPASAAYVSANGKFVWQQDANTSADMDFGSAIMRNDTANSFALTLQPPTLGANYSITLPALPASQKIMTMDNSGIMSAPYTVDGSTIAISGNVLGVPAGGITATQMANQTITATQIANATITSAQNTASTYQKSSSCGDFITSSTSYVSVTNLSCTITTVASRPVYIFLIPADGTGQSSLAVGKTSTLSGMQWIIRRDSTAIASGSIVSQSAVSGGWLFPVSTISTIDDAQTAASHTYDVQVKMTSGSGEVFSAKLVAWQPNA